jgi:hypothetical protein
MKKGIVSPYPKKSQMETESKPGEDIDEVNDPEYEGTPHMADGGIIGFDPDKLQGDLSQGTSDQIPPVAGVFSPPPKNQLFQEPPMEKTMQGTMAQPVGSQPKLPGMPPGIGSDEIMRYIQQQKGQLNKFGPQQQVDLENNLINQRNSFGSKLTSGLKGFGDALMQGVARAGNPGWQQQYENQQMAQGQEQLGTLQKAHEGQIQQTKMGMDLDMANPTSSISKAYKESFIPIFEKLGYSPKAVDKMSGAQVATVADTAVKYADTQTKLEIQKALMEIDALKTQAGITNAQQERLQANETLKAQHPIQNIFGMIPNIGKTAGTGVTPPFNHATIASGETYQAPDGTWRKKQ